MKLGIDGRYINDHFPGIARYTFNLVDALARVAPQQIFALLYNSALTDTRFGVAKLGRHSNVELVKTDVPTFSLAEQWKLPRLVRTLSLDVLHSPYYIKPYLLPCASIVTIHDIIPLIYPQHLPSWWAGIVYRFAIALAVHSTDAVITDSHSAARDLQWHCKVPAAKLTVIPIAAAPAFRPQPRQAIEALRQKYNLPKQYALFLSSNKPHKNLLRLVEAWNLLHRRCLTGGVKLVVAGHWDSRYPKARQCAFDLGLAEEILFLSAVAEEELPALYSGAMLFIFPSLYEGFGLPVLEAMACGTPVVCSNSSSLPEVVEDAALFFDPTKVEAIAEALCEALADPVLRVELRERGLARAARFSWDRTAEETVLVYRRTVGSDRKT